MTPKSGIVGRSPRGWSAVRQICVPRRRGAAELVLLWLSGLVFGQRGVDIRRRHPALAQILAQPLRAVAGGVRLNPHLGKARIGLPAAGGQLVSTASSAAWSMSASRPASLRAPARRGCIHGAPANPPPCAATRQRPLSWAAPSRKHSRAGRCQPGLRCQSNDLAPLTKPSWRCYPTLPYFVVLSAVVRLARSAALGFVSDANAAHKTQQGNVGQARNTTKRVLVNHLQQTAVVQLAVFGQGGFLALFCAGFELGRPFTPTALRTLFSISCARTGLSFRYSRTLSLAPPIFWPL